MGKALKQQFIMSTSTEIRKEVKRGALQLSRVYTSKFQKSGTVTAEIKQTIVTKSFYPGMSVKSNLQDNIFGLNEFAGATEKEFTSTETRVAWLDVPAGTTPEQIMAKLSQLPEARLYKIMSNKPILSDNQKNGIANGLTTLDAIAGSQVVRYPSTHPQANGICLDSNGKVQYRAVYFKASEQEDLDHRTVEAEDCYISPEIKAELNAVSYGVAVEDSVM